MRLRTPGVPVNPMNDSPENLLGEGAERLVLLWRVDPGEADLVLAVTT
ncbi:MAG: hypothetical protein HQ581_09635 [Planctomycetes bacterium]|nr:hypothetical protein [Planctomycetota bacterium]